MTTETAHAQVPLTPAKEHNAAQGQQHPLGIYFVIWGLLFVLSTFSYLVDYFNFVGFARWSLILSLMWLKAGLIVAVFMHMRWERLALVYAILIPPLLLGILVTLMSLESDYTFWTRIVFFGLFRSHPGA
jgi:cytochrome c oxidase subunit IV